MWNIRYLDFCHFIWCEVFNLFMRKVKSFKFFNHIFQVCSPKLAVNCLVLAWLLWLGLFRKILLLHCLIWLILLGKRSLFGIVLNHEWLCNFTGFLLHTLLRIEVRVKGETLCICLRFLSLVRVNILNLRKNLKCEKLAKRWDLHVGVEKLSSHEAIELDLLWLYSKGKFFFLVGYFFYSSDEKDW